MEALQVRRWTRQEYDRMVEAGVLAPGERAELIDGEVLATTPQGSVHATAVLLVEEALRASGSGRVLDRECSRPACGGVPRPHPEPQARYGWTYRISPLALPR